MPVRSATKLVARILALGKRNSGGSNIPTVKFTSSDRYWEERYEKGGNSGAGSYNRLARYKAAFLNAFVADRGVQTVLEFGSGDGAQVALAEYPTYVGVDISRTAVDTCRRKFSDRPNLRFIHADEDLSGLDAELTLSLDVIYHLVEDDIFESYMKRIFDASSRFTIIYSSNEDGPSGVSHVRHREFTAWVMENRPDFTLTEQVANPYPFDPSDPANTSFADFYVFERQCG